MHFVLFPLVVLQDWVEKALFGLDLLVSNMLDVTRSFAKRSFGSFILLIHMHFVLPCVQIILIVIEDHLKFQ